MSVSGIIAEVFSKFDVEISDSLVRNILTTNLELAYRQAKLSYHKTNVSDPKKKLIFSLKQRLFLLEYAEAKKVGDGVIIYTDESYIHTTSHANFSWFSTNDPDPLTVEKSKGKRLIIIHAMCIFGLLCVRNALQHETYEKDGKSKLLQFLTNSEKFNLDISCELITEAMDHNTEDYHNNVDSDGWIKWVKEKFIPTFEKFFGRGKKRCFLMIDNAPYHKASSSDQYNFEKLTKKDSADILAKSNILELVINTKKYNSSTFNRFFPVGPPADAMKQIVCETLINSMQFSRQTIVEKLFMDWSKESTNGVDENFHKILWSVPNSPEMQPIEEVWGLAKRYAKSKYSIGRNVETLLEHVQEGFNTIKPKSCEEMVNKAVKFMNKLVQSDEVLDGSIENMSVKSSSTFNSSLEKLKTHIVKQLDKIRYNSDISNVNYEFISSGKFRVSFKYEEKEKVKNSGSDQTT